MKAPETRYARSGEARLAYQVVGQGSLDLVFVAGWLANLEVHWEDAAFGHFLQRVASFARLILFDERGTGLSDRIDPHNPPGLEARANDLQAVLDAAGSGRTVLSGLISDLIAGSGLHFVERDGEPIEGVEGRLRILAVMVEQHLEPQMRAARMPDLDASLHLSGRRQGVLRRGRGARGRPDRAPDGRPGLGRVEDR
jgi:hypothetical protein